MYNFEHMTKVQAIFKNGVFRPTEPVQVDDGASVELSFEESTHARGIPALTIRPTDGLPVIISPPGTRPITNEDVARGLEED